MTSRVIFMTHKLTNNILFIQNVDCWKCANLSFKVDALIGLEKVILFIYQALKWVSDFQNDFFGTPKLTKNISFTKCWLLKMPQLIFRSNRHIKGYSYLKGLLMSLWISEWFLWDTQTYKKDIIYTKSWLLKMLQLVFQSWRPHRIRED